MDMAGAEEFRIKIAHFDSWELWVLRVVAHQVHVHCFRANRDCVVPEHTHTLPPPHTRPHTRTRMLSPHPVYNLSTTYHAPPRYIVVEPQRRLTALARSLRADLLKADQVGMHVCKVCVGCVLRGATGVIGVHRQQRTP